MKRHNNSRYLLLMEPEDEFPEQLTSYVFLVMEMLLLAKKTDRIFVLPHLHSHPRNNSVAEKGETDHKKFILGKLIFPMESIFDKKELNKYVTTISFQDFLTLSQHRLSTLFCFGNPHYNIVESYGEKFYCENIIDTRDVEEVTKSTDRIIGITGYRRGKYLVPSSPNWPKDMEKDYWEIRKHLQFNKDLIHKADSFISRNQLKKYIAVHWRRGDRVHPEMTTMSEIIVEDKEKMKKLLDEYLVEPIQHIMEDRGLNKVFLATNSGTKWHLDYLKKRLPISQYPASGSWKMREKESIVEQIICSKSGFFLAAPFNYKHCSSFSRWIIDLKIISGNGDAVSHQKKMGAKEVFTQKKTDPILQVKTRILSVSVPIIKRILKVLKKTLQYRPRFSRLKIKTGTLFKQHEIKLDANSMQVGGSWMPFKRGSRPITNDPKILEVLYDHIPKDKFSVLYDIGASTGSFSMLAKFNPKISVYAFEPQSNVHEILLHNIELNNLTDKVTTFRIALSDKEAVLPLQIPKKLSQSGLATLGAPLRFTQAESVSVASTTLDYFTKQFNLPDPTHIKIDTEGAELLVLKGGEQLIRRKKPIILLECDEKNTVQFGYHAKELTILLTNLGYKIVTLAREDILCLPN